MKVEKVDAQEDVILVAGQMLARGGPLNHSDLPFTGGDLGTFGMMQMQMQMQGAWWPKQGGKLFRVIPRGRQATRGMIRVSERVKRDVIRRKSGGTSRGV